MRRSCKRVVCDARRRRLEYKVALCMYDMSMYGANESHQNSPTRRLGEQRVALATPAVALPAQKGTIQRLR